MPEVFEFEEDVVEETSTEEQEQEEQEEREEETQEEQEEGEVSPAQELAASEGWVPEEDWKGDPEEWVSYKEFNYRGELMTRIKSQSKQIHPLKEKIAELSDAISVLGDHNKKVAETEYKRAIKDLKSQKRNALEDDDYDAADEIDEQLDELKEAKNDLKAEASKEEKGKQSNKQQELPPAQKQIVKDWYEDTNNKWYQEEEMLRPIADQLFISRLENNGGDFYEAFTYMGTKMQSKFPNEVGGGHKKGGSVTESSGRSAGKARGSKNKFTKRNLSDDQARVGKTFVDMGVYDDIQEYVNQLVETGEIS